MQVRPYQRSARLPKGRFARRSVSAVEDGGTPKSTSGLRVAKHATLHAAPRFHAPIPQGVAELSVERGSVPCIRVSLSLFSLRFRTKATQGPHHLLDVFDCVQQVKGVNGHGRTASA
jgi:hypothetical protein